jgi:type II secretory pathway component HofQ
VSDTAAPKRKRPNADEKRALKSAKLQLFVQSYGRRAQKGVEPNDRSYEREVEKAVKRMRPDELDRLLREDEDDIGP